MHSSVYLCIFGASCPLYGYSRFGSDIKQPLRTPFGDIILGADNHDRVISGDGAKHAFDGLLIDDAGHILRGAGWRMHDHEITCRGHGCDQSGQYPANLLLGFGVRVRSRMFINVLFADGVGHGSIGKTGLRGVNLIEITAQRGLRHLDALVGENLRQLRLRGDDTRQQRLLNGAQSSGSCGRTLQRGRCGQSSDQQAFIATGLAGQPGQQRLLGVQTVACLIPNHGLRDHR